MSNRLVEVKIDLDLNNMSNVIYSWRRNELDGWKTVYHSKRSTFRVLIIDIYKDKVPISNITIDRNLENEFEQYKTNHRTQIEQLQQLQPTDWSVNQVVQIFSAISFDSDND